MSNRVSILQFLLFISLGMYAQRSFVLWDKVNNVPVSKASVYFTSNGRVNCIFSGQQGRANVSFDFDSLVVSHINYKKMYVKSLPDTLFLEPVIQILPDVVIGETEEPGWIKPMLRNFVKSKTEKYRNDVTLEYDYQTQNVGDTTLYRFESKGLVKKPELFEICPEKNVITYKDSTAGCDFSALKNVLYHDFVSDVDEKFVKEHKFYLDDQTEGLDANVVRILFKSRKERKDSGYLCIDTVRNVILRAKRSTGLDYNVKDKTDAFVRSTFVLLAGLKYNDWQIDVETEYQQSGSSFYLSNCRYSNHKDQERDIIEKKVRTRVRSVSSMTSTYKAHPYYGEPPCKNKTFIILPKPWVMKIIITKNDQLQEKALQNVRKDFKVY